MNDVDYSITYPMIQALLSIIIGLCLSKLWSTFAIHVKRWNNTTPYIPYYLLLFSQSLTLMSLWFGSPYIYGILIKKHLGLVLLGLTGDGCAVITTYLMLPSDQELNQYTLDLREWYIKNKRKFFTGFCVWAIIGCFLGYFMGLLGLGATLFNILFTLIMGVLLWYIDNYYLHMYAHIQAIFLWILLLVK